MTYGRAFVAGILALVGALLPAAVGAQISIDGSLRPGTAGPLTGPDFVIGSGVGRTVGNNLFHSFGQFNVGAGERATFTGLGSIGNVISRVTGGQPSSINGLIDTRTFMPSANFFLLNPAGVMLGAGASLNVGGAFHLSTADYLCLGSGGCLADPTAGKFFASLGRGDVLTVAAPAAFGFLGPPTGSIGIVVDGSSLPGDIPDPPVGQTMSLVGGQIQVTNATLSPPGGHVQLVSVNSMGEVPISTLDVRGFSALSSITVTGSTLNVSGDSAGSVVIRGGNLLIDTSAIAAGTSFVDGAPVGIELSAAGSLTINSSALISSTFGDGRAGDIRLSGTNLELTNGSVALSIRGGAGAGGDVSLTADTLTLSGGSAVLSQNFAEGPARNGNVSATATGAMLITEGSTLQSTADVGDGGQVSVSAGSLTMEIGASIASSAATGRGGDVVVTAPQLTLRSGAQISSSISDSGRGGDIRLSGTGLELTDGSTVLSSTSGSGRGGDILLSGTSVELTNGSTLFSSTSGDGRGGDILLSGGSLRLTNGAVVLSSREGAGAGGDVSLTGDTVTIAGGSAVLSVNQAEGPARNGNISVSATGAMLVTESGTLQSIAAAGDGGQVSVTAGSLIVESSASISSSTATGFGGEVVVTAPQLTIRSGGQISSTVFDVGRGGDVRVISTGSATIEDPLTSISTASFFFNAEAPGLGSPGDVLTSFGSLTLTRGATIQSGVEGGTQAGNVSLVATGPIVISDGAGIGSVAFFKDAGNITISAPQVFVRDGFINTGTRQSGRAGDISIAAGTLALENGGQIVSASIDQGGPGGDVHLNIGGSLTISGRSPTGGSVLPEFFSVFFTDPRSGIYSTTAGSAPGGNIAIQSAQIQLLDSGTISASSTGEFLGSGPAGHINVTASGSITITGSSSGFFSTTAGTGPGGNITLRAAQLQLADGGTISSSSARTTPDAPPASGPAGHIDVTASESITITGVSPTGASGLFSTTADTGSGGNITLRAPQIQLAAGGTISAASTGVLEGSGPAGQINVTAGESITITGASPTGAAGLFSTTAGTGPGGNITLHAPQIRLADGGTISASSTGTAAATAGSIDITFGGLFEMDHASISTDSKLADGGNITITSTGSLLHLVDSQMTTSVKSGVGGGGNITLGSTGHPLDFIVLDNSGIHADAFGGPGGNINIFANVMFSSTPIETAVTASSALSAPGTVSINAVITDVSGSLAELSTEVLGAAALLRASCAARLAEGKTSSLVVAGREGLPLEPGGLLPSALRELHAAGVAGSAAPFFASEWPGLRLSYLDAACGR